jgi:hypothetical protein
MGMAVRRHAGRARGALTTAQNVGRDHEPPVGVQRAAGPDELPPPTGGGVPRAGRADDVAVSGQRMQHQNGVVAAG